MNGALWLLLGLAIGLAVSWWLTRHLRDELAFYRKELATAQDRLVYAWREDRAIPAPRPSEPMRAPEALPMELQAEVDQWESAETRAGVEAKIRELHFGRGLNVMGVLKAMENEHP